MKRFTAIITLIISCGFAAETTERAYANVNTRAEGQQIDGEKLNADKPGSGAMVVVKFKEPTHRSDSIEWDEKKHAYVVQADGVYQLTATLSIGGGNEVGDGVIFGFSVNGESPWPAEAGLSDRNVLVLSPAEYKTVTPVTLTTLLRIKKGDTVQAVLAGIDNATFHLSYSSFMILGL